MIQMTELSRWLYSWHCVGYQLLHFPNMPISSFWFIKAYFYSVCFINVLYNHNNFFYKVELVIILILIGLSVLHALCLLSGDIW